MKYIAEIGINHNGNMYKAKALIDKAAEAGCWAVKTQKRTIDLVYTKEELDKPRESPFGTTNREQKKGLELSIYQHQELERYANDKGLEYIVSAWDMNSLWLIEKYLNCRYHKVASAMLTDMELLEAIRDTNKHVILSTGMSTEKEIETAVEVLKMSEGDFILHCTSSYPTKEEEVNLAYISALKRKYGDISIGFSNHYPSPIACIGSMCYGVEMVEFHITLDRTDYGSDQAASIENVRALVEGCQKMRKMQGYGQKIVYESELPVKEKLRKK